MKSLTVAEFETNNAYAKLASGEHILHYHDTTHLLADEWKSVLKFDVHHPADLATFKDGERYYSVTPHIDGKLDEAHQKTLQDVLALALTRVGMLSPDVSLQTYQDVLSLSKEPGLVLIPDSNSLYNGTLHWLLSVLKNSRVWILPFVVSIIQIQERDAKLKALVNKRKINNAREALRSRAFINSALGMLQRQKARYQILELDPSLLRYMRFTASRDGEEGNVLEDRLLVEGIHAVLRSTRTRAKQRVVTSDVLLARILEAEGIPCLFIPSPVMPQGTVPCISYNPISSCFSGAPLRMLLWDLAHALSSVRLSPKSGPSFTLNAYWPSKSPEDWGIERLSVDDTDSISPQAKPKQVKKEIAIENPTPADSPSKSFLSKAALPQASLPQILRLAGAILNAPPSTPDQAVMRLSGDKTLLPGTARRAFEILVRINAATFDGKNLEATERCALLDAALGANDLDAISEMFSSFPPYRIVLMELKKVGHLKKESVETLLQRELGEDVGSEASIRLTRYHTLLGQAYTDDQGNVHDGSNRPDDAEFLRGFRGAFRATSQDGFAKVTDVLLKLSQTLRMSPWSIQKRLDPLAARGELSQYTFPPAAGKRPEIGDRVIAGRLDQVLERAVPIDRFEIGGRPIFTVGGKA